MAIVADAANTSGLTVLLHPLVVVNVSDHFARTCAQAGVPDATGPWHTRLPRSVRTR